MTAPIEINNTINANIKELNTTPNISKKKTINIIIKKEPIPNFIPSPIVNLLPLSLFIVQIKILPYINFLQNVKKIKSK